MCSCYRAWGCQERPGYGEHWDCAGGSVYLWQAEPEGHDLQWGQYGERRCWPGLARPQLGSGEPLDTGEQEKSRRGGGGPDASGSPAGSGVIHLLGSFSQPVFAFST